MLGLSRGEIPRCHCFVSLGGPWFSESCWWLTSWIFMSLLCGYMRKLMNMLVIFLSYFHKCFFQLFLLVFLTFVWFACKTGGLCLLVVLRTGACVQESSSMQKMFCGGSMLINWHACVYYTFWSTTYVEHHIHWYRFYKLANSAFLQDLVWGAQSSVFVGQHNSFYEIWKIFVDRWFTEILLIERSSITSATLLAAP